MLIALIVATSLDSTPTQSGRDYVAPIERYVDSMAMIEYDDGYYQMIERRHLREKGPSTNDLRPTYYNSPFVKPHGEA